MPDDKMPDNYQSDTEDSAAREGDDNGPTSIASSVSSHKAAPQGLITAPTTEHSPAGQLHGGPFVNDLPVRPAQYPHSLITSELEQHHYAEGGGMTVGAPPALQPHGGMAMTDILASHDTSSRRPSFYSPSEYSSTPSNTLYSTNWQTATTAPSTTPMYANAFTPQQQHHAAQAPPGTYVQQPQQPQQQSVTMAQGQPYMGAAYDGLGARYEPVPDMFRPAAVAHNPASQSPGYPTYVNHDTRALPGTGYKLDPVGRNALH